MPGLTCAFFQILAGGKAVFQQRAQAHFAPDAARLDVCQHLFQIAHALRQRLHLAKALVDARELFIDQPEGLAEAIFQRAFQLFGDGLAHLFQFLVVEARNGVEALVQRPAHLFETVFVEGGNGIQPLLHAPAQVFLARLHGQRGVGKLLGGGRARGGLAEVAHALVHGHAQPRQKFCLPVRQAALHSRALARLAPARADQTDEQHRHRQQWQYVTQIEHRRDHHLETGYLYYTHPARFCLCAEGSFAFAANLSLQFPQKWCIILKS